MEQMKINLQRFAGATIAGSSTADNCDCRIVWTSEDVEGTNTSKVTANVQIYKSGSSETTGTFSGTLKIDGTSYSISKKDTWSWGTWHTVGSKTKTVTHNEDGKKSITISCSLSQTGTSMAGTYTASGTATLDTINRASVLGDIPNFKIDELISIPITKYVSTFTDTLVISYEGTTIKSVNNITDGHSFTFTSLEQTTIKSLMTSPQIKLTFTLTTSNGGTTIGTDSKTALVSSLDVPVYRNVIKKDNGKYQTAINGLIDPTNTRPLQVYDDDGVDMFGRIPVTITGLGEGSTYTCFYYPLLRMCFLRLYSVGKAVSADSATTLGTVDSAYAPGYIHALAVYRGLSSNPDIKVNIQSDGDIRIYSETAMTASNSVYITGFWYT